MAIIEDQILMWAVVSRRGRNKLQGVFKSKWKAKAAAGKLSDVVRVSVLFDPTLRMVTIRTHEYTVVEAVK